MCLDPVTMISIGATVLGTITQVAGQRQAAQARADQAAYDARVASNNAKLAQMEADDTREVGREEEARHRARVASLIGEARATLASSGFDVTEADAPVLIGEIAEVGEQDAQTIRREAENRARGLEFEAANFTAQQGVLARQAEVPAFTGVGTALSGIGLVADRWHRARGGTSLPSSPPSSIFT